MDRGELKEAKLNDRFGVFLYNKETDEFLIYYSGWYEKKSDALIHALNLWEEIYHVMMEMDKYYMEVWEKDEDGLYGNNGVPIWASYHSGFYKEV